MTRKSVIARDVKRQKTVERYAAKRAALKYKYKPMIRDGVAVEVPGVKQRITFILEGEGKGPGYIPQNCQEMY